jgi:hypothetical protein
MLGAPGASGNPHFKRDILFFTSLENDCMQSRSLYWMVLLAHARLVEMHPPGDVLASAFNPSIRSDLL